MRPRKLHALVVHAPAESSDTFTETGPAAGSDGLRSTAFLPLVLARAMSQLARRCMLQLDRADWHRTRD